MQPLNLTKLQWKELINACLDLDCTTESLASGKVKGLRNNWIVWKTFMTTYKAHEDHKPLVSI